MVTIVKHEWHSHDRQYTCEIDEDILSEIYPDLDEDEIASMLKQIEDGEIDIEDVINEAWENDIEVDWEFQYDDCWTDRKGGYEVTYELGDENSYHSDPEPDPPSHKCTKCRWEGSKWETRTVYVNEQGEVLPDDCDEFHDTKDGCPMCDSDITLTEFGVQAEKERAERQARWDREAAEAEEAVPCYSCGAMHKESELPEIKESGYYCPDCREGWVMMDSREEEPVDEEELARALEELKAEFETLTAESSSVDICPMKCTKCEWTGDWTDTETNEHQEDVCPKCGSDVEDVENE